MKYVLILPAVLFFAMFLAWPLAELFFISMHKIDFITSRFVGFDNYISMFKNPAFIQSIRNSAVYMILLTIGQVGLALIASLALFSLRKKWHDFSRVAFYLPVLSAGVIISQAWRWAFSYEGPINYAIGKPVQWFGNSYTGIAAVSIVLILSVFGQYVIILLAAITSVDKSIIEAAALDGAAPWRVIIPVIAPTIGMCATLAAIAAPQIYETVAFLAPYDHTASVTFQIYHQAFQLSRHGQAAAMAVFLLLVTAGLTIAKDRTSA